MLTGELDGSDPANETIDDRRNGTGSGGGL